MLGTRRASLWATALIFCAACLYFLGNHTVSLWDRDEPRYAECAREMLLTGDWVVPRYLGELRLEKPPAIYWFQGAMMRLFGDTDFAARVPSSLGIVLSAVLIYFVVKHFVGSVRALWTLLVFCSAGLVIASAKMCITDASLLLFVAVGQACLALMYASDRTQKRCPASVAPCFWISMGIAGLIKGPQALGMHAMLFLILTLLTVGNRVKDAKAWGRAIQWIRFTRPLVGIPLLVIVVTPWLYMVHYRSDGFISQLVLRARMHAGQSMDGHGSPPGYHALLICGTFFPWSLFLPITLAGAWARRKSPVVRFAIASAMGPWLLMECVKTKLPFYVLPAFPGLAFLTADAILRGVRRSRSDLKSIWFKVGVYVWCAATVLLAFAPCAVFLVTRNVPYFAISLFAVCGIAYSVIVFVFAQKRDFARMISVMGIGMMIMIAILYGGVFSHLQILQISRNLAEALKGHGGYGLNTRVSMIGYKEPSMAFYQGGGAREEDDAYLQGTPSDQWTNWIIIDEDAWKLVPQNIKQQWQTIGEQTGLDYSEHGKYTKVYAMKRKPIAR